jgi:hypothetical protein
MELPLEIIGVVIEHAAMLSLTCKTYYQLLTPKAKVIAYFDWYKCTPTNICSCRKWYYLGEYCKDIGLLIHTTSSRGIHQKESLRVELAAINIDHSLGWYTTTCDINTYNFFYHYYPTIAAGSAHSAINTDVILRPL